MLQQLDFSGQEWPLRKAPGGQNGGPPALKRAVISPVKSQRQSGLRGYSSVVERLVRNEIGADSLKLSQALRSAHQRGKR